MSAEEQSGALPPENLTGLALSGGGIRSATFCLGLLQGLNEKGLLPLFDYLSTVSGGGYTGGWWSAWLVRKDDRQRGKDNIFPPPEQLAPEAYSTHEFMRSAKPGNTTPPRTKLEVAASCNIGQERIADVLSAGDDPIHHLRLFGNYLTPRKGALSADTWRAVTIISRNLLLTWLILLPLLFAAVIVGQLYFVLQSGSYYDKSPNYFFADPYLSSPQVLAARLWLVVKPLIGIVLWIVALICAWMINSGEAGKSRNRYAGWAGAGAVLIFFVMLCLILYGYAGRPGAASFINAPVIVWLLLGGLIVTYACYLPRVQEPDAQPVARGEYIQRRREVRRNRIMRIHAKLLVLLIATAFVLFFAGFGHEVVNFLNSSKGIPAYVKKAGGWSAVLLSIGLSLYTALKTAPSGGHDRREMSKPTLFNRVVFAVTPPLVLVVLAVLTSWASVALLSHINDSYIAPLQAGAEHDSSLILLFATMTCAGIVLSLFFALIETRWKRGSDGSKGRVFWVLSGLLLLLALMTFVPLVNVFTIFFRGKVRVGWNFSYSSLYWLVAAVVFIAHALSSYFILSGLTEDKQERVGRRFWPRFIIIALWVSVTCYAVYALRDVLFTTSSQVSYGTTRVFLFSLIICLVFLLLERWRGDGDNRRALSLLAAVYVFSFVLLLFSWMGEVPLAGTEKLDIYKRLLLGQTVAGLLGMLLTWVVAFGWMADPNALSLHLFYKSRLVRAYLGASNLLRGKDGKEVTEAVEQDDVPLHALRNCERGAPYHLINTTLNLVGGRDLSTAQRSSAYFTLSKQFCGSTRTGYRPTQDYMDGRMSLGTALAVSGAAASPNMGAMTLTSSLAMLMTLLNVRLGFWAPTPHNSDWREPSARLWPFYMLREFFSQTNDLSNYCYLTDGGHFDNTGLYSLVERACRYIVVAECGADPRPCFQDLGTAIRRCRIDFNAEITLDISPLERGKEKGALPAQFVVVGEIHYDERHLRSLLPVDARGTKAGDEWIARHRVGRIVLFKPALTTLKKETPDVRQYGLENDLFPQQSTVDLWYDEAQFESYRRLGQLSAEGFFDKNRLDRSCRTDGTYNLEQLFVM
jgi:hypothetical protein